MQPRKGLTLVEMLVALALTIFMMAILSEAFVTGLKAFRRLKAIGDMDEQLRTVATVLRRDLQSEHFDGYRRLSNYGLGTLLTDGTYDRPHQGFFCVAEGVAGGVTSTREDTVPDNVMRPSYYDNDGDKLAFTMRLAGNRPETFFYGSVPARARNAAAGSPQPLDAVGRYTSRFDDSAGDRRYSSQWAEVAYYIERDGTRTTSDENYNPVLPIFKLYRTQLLLVPETFVVNAIGSATPTVVPAYETAETYATWNNAGTITTITDTAANKWLSYFAGQVGTANQYTHDVSAWAEPQGVNWQYRYNSPADIQFRERRFGEAGGNYARLGSIPGAAIREGADLLAVNVIGWDVKVYDPYAIKAVLIANPNQFKYLAEFVDLGHNSAGTTNLPMPTTDGIYTYAWNTDATNVNNGTIAPLFRGVGNNPSLPRTFDSWSNRNNGLWNYADNNLYPLPYAGPMTAVQIRIRIWDEVTKQTRQVSIVVDL